jgi:2,4-dienoyl-CoA reductase-like NADH-dependent reductase (Old Yellow Enzyme family)/NAD(P)-dependent dehydrogenase (short-subunit alcohol dehydrogenase family)
MKRDKSVAWHRVDESALNVEGKQVAIVGGTGGIGRAVSRNLASLGADVIVVGQTFRDADVSSIKFIQSDLSLMSEAQRVAAELPVETLDMVIFTTGIFAAPQRQETAEGIERDLAVSYLNRLVILRAIAPRLGTQRPKASMKPRVFLMGYPGSGQIGTPDDLNAEKSYKAMPAHMNTVAGNEMLVLDAAKRYPHATFFGLGPGLIKTNIRDNFLGKGSLKSRAMEGLIGLLTPTAETYAKRITPLLLTPDIEGHGGAMFNNKGQAIRPSVGLTESHIRKFMAASLALVAQAGTQGAALPERKPTSRPFTRSKDSIMSQLFNPVRVGRFTLANRLVMAPMTRSRAEVDGTPNGSAVTYYTQRASVGLMVSEGTQPSEDGQGYLTTPGIYTDAHVAGWQAVSSAVHAKGGHLFIQLMHAGRMSHPDNTPHHRQGVAPSAIAPGTGMFTIKGMQDIPVPRALTTEEVRQTVQDYRYAARRAIEAGADGVEIHGANAYLIQQFFAPSANTRTDEYGGSIENRARFAIEIAKAIAEEIGADRTAIRLSPGTAMWGIDEGGEGPDLYRYLVAELDKLGLAYLHVMHLGNDLLLVDLRNIWKGSLILNRPGRPRGQIGFDVASGLAELEAYGAMVLANPDFVERIKSDAPMNEPRRESFFGGTEKGYTDYPTLREAQGV